MSNNRILLFLFSFIIFTNGFAQNDSFDVRYPELFEGFDQNKISHSDSKISFIFNYFSGNHELLIGVQKKYPYLGNPAFFKYYDRWFITYSGSGILFQLDSKYKKAKRIDKTISSGYNYGQFTFINNGIIHSIGGYGFWSMNAYLRKYTWSVSNEWELEAASYKDGIFSCHNEFSLIQVRPSLESALGDSGLSIIVANAMISNNKSNDFSKTRNVYQLNLPDYTWKLIGEVNETLSQVLYLQQDASYVFATKDTLLYCLDIFKNSYSTLDLLFYKKQIYPYLKGYKTFVQLSKDKILLFDLDTKKWSRILIPVNKWSQNNELVYHPKPWYIQLNWLLILTMIILILLIGLSIYYRQQLNNYKQPELIVPSFTTTQVLTGFKNNLDNIEIEILNHIIQHDNSITIINFNNILGLSNKAPNVQKLYRHKVLKSINDKFAYSIGQDQALIFRSREEDDKRVFSYHIEKDYLEVIRVLL